MKFVKNQISKDLYRQVEAISESAYIVRVNAKESDDVIIFDECILPYIPTDEKIAALEDAAKECEKPLEEAARIRNLKTEISECKRELSSLDYKTIKRLQGELSDEEWESVCKTCRQLRERINTAESALASVDGERTTDSRVD